MPKSGTTKTFVACRPGLLQQMQKAFAGMDIRVVDDLTVDYEFQQEEMTGMDLVMAELENEERMKADPKHAHTFVIPLIQKDYVSVPEDYESSQYLLVRTQDDVGYHTVQAAIKKAKLQQAYDGEVEVTATIAELHQVLKDEGVNVLSISEADRLTELQS